MNFRFVAFMLSRLFFAYSAILLVPLFAAIFYDNDNIVTFAGSMAIPMVIGAVLQWFGRRQRGHMNVRDAVFIVAVGWIAICFLGALPYFIGIPRLSFVTCLFESTSMWTTTGASTFVSVKTLPVSFMVLRTFGHWCGAVGVIMLFSLLIPSMKSGSDFILGAELPGRGLERTMPKMRQSVLVILGIFLAVNITEVVLLLCGGMNFWEALNMTMATAATGGLSFYHDGYINFANNYIWGVCLLFMFLGAVNFTLWFKLLKKDWQGIKEDPEHRYFLLVVLVAVALLAINLWDRNYCDGGSAVAKALEMGLSCLSTSGFLFDNISNWPEFSQLLLIFLMLIGGCSASAAGGLKIIRVVIIVKALWAELRSILHPNLVYTVNYGGRVLKPEIVQTVVKFFFLYLLMFTGLVLAASLSGLCLREAFVMVASCMSSVGCGIGSLEQGYSSANDFTRLVATLAMLFGRLEFTTLLAVCHFDFWRNN